MALPLMPRWLAPVLVVVFALTTVWAGYNVANQAAAAQAPPSTGPPLAYAGSGTYGYVASLAPNELFNSTSVSGDNITLFVSITRWINVTFIDTVGFSSAAPASLSDQFTVSLSTPDWSKTLAQTVQRNSSSDAFGLVVIDRYNLSVAHIEALARSIDDQLNYSSGSFTVSFVAEVAGSVTWGPSAGPFVLGPWLNLTFAGSVIGPKGAPATARGSVPGASTPSDPAKPGSMTAAYVELAASIGALAVSVWLLWLGRRAGGAAPLPELDRLIEPYEEVIARTAQAPEGSKVLPVQRWEDLVKVADTLGRPILRPVATSSNPRGSDFYVYDGTVAYLYRYPLAEAVAPGTRSRPASAEAPRNPRGPSVTAPVPPLPGAPVPADRRVGPAPSASAPTGSPVTTGAGASPAPVPADRRGPPSPGPSSLRSSSPPASNGPPASGARPSREMLAALPKGVTDELERQLRRIRSATLDPAQRWYAFSLFTQAVRTVSSVGPQQAPRIVDELKRALDRVLSDAGRAG